AGRDASRPCAIKSATGRYAGTAPAAAAAAPAAGGAHHCSGTGFLSRSAA
ncbi:MAG: hypothetical protein JO089_02615, partial [Alphaproteobacteria bacterium]|nr:hypothetical protein [Alphaproteobacteria bacterium]